MLWKVSGESGHDGGDLFKMVAVGSHKHRDFITIVVDGNQILASKQQRGL